LAFTRLETFTSFLEPTDNHNFIGREGLIDELRKEEFFVPEQFETCIS